MSQTLQRPVLSQACSPSSVGGHNRGWHGHLAGH
jgi:hypothetical protein